MSGIHLSELEIMCLIHASGRVPNPTEEDVTDARNRLYDCGLFEEDGQGSYELSERGQVMLNHLTELPLPKPQTMTIWVRPEGD
jgi:hypothetical protein